MRVKVCGITQEEQLIKLAETGVTFVGLIFYPKSPRYVLRQMTTSQIKKESNINKVGVFVNASVEEVLQMVDECRLHMVQLHGDETPRYCEKIADYISVVKAFRISDSENLGWRIKDYMEVCDMFMFDTEGAGYGGTGKKFNWGKLHDVAVGKPYFLSGGIEPGDVEKLKEFSKLPEAKGLFAIDINSKFEILPGIKDMEKIKKFIQHL
ncbi:phosphoribosylanthranilate isomerase [Ferruginibacter sp.]|uniref:phosphoribosylanthranilate isomerase n=1 Tax=Ferruginibacter sp. TaxID=1940288 RepID=UPI002659A1F5|nr:phosphoribosylanthranilate isomerase [Ferruginibacter sp.]